MKLFIDTTLVNLSLALYNDNFKCIDFFTKEIKHKSDLLSSEVKNILSRNKLSFENINDIYVTQGPGSFMGVRAGIIFVRTLKQINEKLNIYINNSFEFINNDHFPLFIKASKKECFVGIKKKEWEITIQECTQETKIKYSSVLKNGEFLKNFKLVNSFEEIKPLYFKEPQIGEQ